MQSLLARDFRLDGVLRELLEAFFQNLRIRFFNRLRLDARRLGRFPVPGIGVGKHRRIGQAVIVIERGPVRGKGRERDRPFKDQWLAGWGGRQGGHALDSVAGQLFGHAGRGPQRFKSGQCAIGGNFQSEPDLARIFPGNRRSHHAAHLLAPRVAVTLAVLQGVLARERPFFRCWCSRCRLGRRLMRRDGRRRRVLLPSLGCDDSWGRNCWCLCARGVWSPGHKLERDDFLVDLRLIRLVREAGQVVAASKRKHQGMQGQGAECREKKPVIQGRRTG